MQHFICHFAQQVIDGESIGGGYGIIRAVFMKKMQMASQFSGVKK